MLRGEWATVFLVAAAVLVSAPPCRAGGGTRASAPFADKDRAFELAALKEQYDGLESKMLVVTSADINRFIDEALDSVAVDETILSQETFRDNLVDLVYRASVFGNMKSFDLLKAELLKHGIKVYTDGRGASLADAFYYVMLKKVNDEDLESYLTGWDVARDPFWVGANPSRHFLLDPLMVDLMSEYDDMREEIYANFITPGHGVRGGGRKGGLAVPIGLFGGITMFNQLHARSTIATLAAKLYDRAAARPGSECGFGGKTVAGYPCWQRSILRDFVLDALDEVFLGLSYYDRERIEGEITWLGEEPYPLTATGMEGRPGRGTVEMIVENLYPRIPSWNQYKSALAKPMQCGIGHDIADVLVKYGRFLSFNNLAKYAMSVLANLTRLKVQGSVRPIESYYYIIPEDLKSYSVVIFLYFMNAPRGEVRAHHIIRSDWGAITLAVREQSPIAILDDVSASGTSIIDAVQKLESTYARIKMVPAPLLATIEATGRFSSGLLPYTAGDVVPAAPHRAWMGEMGYGGQSYFITFPYMAPDNNVGAARADLAELFTFRGKGVKLNNTHVQFEHCSTRRRLRTNRAVIEKVLRIQSMEQEDGQGA